MYFSEGLDPGKTVLIAFVKMKLGPGGLHGNHFQSIHFKDDR